MNSLNKWPRPRKIKGAGDLVALVAQPIAKAIDAVAKTNVSGCSACQKRREAMNNVFSFSKP